MSLPMVPIVLGLIGLIFAFILYLSIGKEKAGEGKVAEIAEEIHKGAMVFMKAEYSILALFALVLLVGLFFTLGSGTAIAFTIGAVTSATAGYIGMFTATKANVRTAVAARDKGAASALSIAFYGGSVMGLTIASMGLLGLGILYYMYGQDPNDIHAIENIHGFGMGASVVALFSRVGGGIFTKSADVGADLVGKLEAGIPEDDPRNPGVIADNVGDNVGDVAGMGSDIFESYCGSMIAAIALATTMTPMMLERLGGTKGDLLFLPLALGSVGLLCSLAGIALVKMSANKSPEVALRVGTIGASVVFIVVAYILTSRMGLTTNSWLAVVSGAVGGIIIGLITEYYTSGKPVRTIAKGGEPGAATVLIHGLATGMQSVAIPVITICAIIFISSSLCGLYGRCNSGGRYARYGWHHHGD